MNADSDIVPTVNLAAEEGRSEFYERAATQSLKPLWRVLHGLVTAEPVPRCVPALFRYRDIRPYLIEACQIISAAESERRVLVLENPALPGQSRLTQSLFAGLQIILPGEVAPAHRHIASALRFIIEGKDAYTAVGGERTQMLPGDFVITPSWAWHDHGNESDAPMVWLDGLDMHIVNLLGASFREGYDGPSHPITRPEGASDAEVGSNMLPVDTDYGSATSLIFNYPYARTHEALDRLQRFRAPDACHAHKMKYINPVTGGWAMPSMSTWMQLIPKGFKTAPYRSTDSAIFTVVEGHGESRIGDQTFTWEPHDIFIVPSWMPHTHTAFEDATIFIYSDRVVQEKLDFWREDRNHV